MRIGLLLDFRRSWLVSQPWVVAEHNGMYGMDRQPPYRIKLDYQRLYGALAPIQPLEKTRTVRSLSNPSFHSPLIRLLMPRTTTTVTSSCLVTITVSFL